MGSAKKEKVLFSLEKSVDQFTLIYNVDKYLMEQENFLQREKSAPRTKSLEKLFIFFVNVKPNDIAFDYVPFTFKYSCRSFFKENQE